MATKLSNRIAFRGFHLDYNLCFLFGTNNITHNLLLFVLLILWSPISVITGGCSGKNRRRVVLVDREVFRWQR